MTPRNPGWYPDPQLPNQMRWWDGTAWTSDVYERADPPGEFAQADQSATPARAVGTGVTEDGVRLASFGQRVGARLIDSVIVAALTLPLTWSVVGDLVTRLNDLAATRAGAVVNPFAVQDPRLLRDVALISLVSLVIGLLYELGFLLWRAATPGKLLVGLRVRRWTPGEALGPSVVARRWLGYQGVGQVLGGFYVLIDVAWVLWDPRRQALHDKLAGTCVVVARRERS